ncbi:reverse transcriptase [Corchorus capsularis]|uniref:Reverse transcriptase n=1 Tax=Corchorus capsularis TaxID=210143 RepID=A0A1R3IZF6_COCAP|nr:reverse transcriptase [Corchorus capsularis]
MKEVKIDRMRRRIGFANGICVEPEGLSGGLCLWWKDDVDVKVLKISKNLIHVRVRNKEKLSWFLTCIYAPPVLENRLEFWNVIREVAASVSGAWIIGGDFNEVMTSDEKERGLPLENRRVLPFHDVIFDCGLMDMGFKGQRFTWQNRREANIRERLDRAFINVEWRAKFSVAQCFNLPAVGSEHSPIFIALDPDEKKSSRIFRFESQWTTSDECKTVIENEWQGTVSDSWLMEVIRRFKKCKKALTTWSKKSFPNNRKEIDTLMKELAQIQDNSHSEEEWVKAELIIAKLEGIWAREEMFWNQRSRVKWLKYGNWVEKEDDVERLLLNHYASLFRSTGAREWREALDHVDKVVTDDMNEMLTREVTEEEIKSAAFDMGALKAPGPDGFSGIFYQKYWEVVGDLVINAVKEFFRTGFLPQKLNKTNIVLIPKVDNPKEVGQFRPISLCNFMYKVLSKVLVNRMKGILTDIITPSQCAFVPQRQIQDNIFIAHEAFHHLKLKKSKKDVEMGLKLDMNKAYDRVEWDFLKEVMLKMGFDNDSLFFLKAEPENCRRMAEILSQYCRASGQQVNFQKSSLFFNSNCPDHVKEECGNIFNIQTSGNPGKYLGLPSVWGRSKEEALGFLKDRMIKKIQGWKKGLLSQAGFCSKLESIVAKFWWGDNEDKRKIRWQSWKKLTRAKKVGGLGFRELYFFNKVLIAKQSWRILQNPNAFWVYSGENVDLWDQAWIPGLKGEKLGYKPDDDEVIPRRVKDIMDVPQQKWRLDLIAHRISDMEASAIEDTPINETGICKEKVETVKHLLLLCPWTTPVWFEGCASMRIDRGAITNFADWWMNCFEDTRLNEEDLMSLAARAAFITWYIWKGRNEVHFNGKEPDAKGTLIRAEKAWQEYHSANSTEKKKILTRTQKREPWSPPANDIIKINVDGAYDCKTGEAAVGVIARGANGMVVDGLGKKVRASSCDMAEVMAVREGIRLAKEKRWERVILETDSQEALTDCIKDDSVCAWEVKPLVQDIKVWSRSIRELEMIWVPRSANGAAHWVAVSTRKGMCNDDWKLPPQFAKGFQRCLVNKLPEDRFILICDGKSWAVEVVNVAKDEVYFREGWKEFVHDNSLGIGGLIVFEYQGDFKFNLDIFGRQCSRKGVSPDIWEKYNVPQKGEKPTINGGGQATSELSQQEGQPTMGGGGQGTSETQETNLAALKKSKKFKSKSLNFKVTMQPTYVQGTYLNVTNKFTKKIRLSHGANNIKLKVSDKTWDVKISDYPRHGKIHSGWRKFVDDNSLKENDICLFKLINSQDLTLDVTISRFSQFL